MPSENAWPPPVPAVQRESVFRYPGYWATVTVLVILGVAATVIGVSVQHQRDQNIIDGLVRPSTGAVAAPSRPSPSTSASRSRQVPPAAGGSTLRLNWDGGDGGADVTVDTPPPGTAKVSVLASSSEHLRIFRVTYVGRSGKVSINPLYWSAQNAAGDTYDEALGDLDNQIPTTELSPGERVRGFVAFDVPKGQRIASIVLSDDSSAPVLRWKVG